MNGAFGYLHWREHKFVLCEGRKGHMDICWSQRLTVAETTSCPFTLARFSCSRTFASDVSRLGWPYPDLFINLLIPSIGRLFLSHIQTSAYTPILFLQWGLSSPPKLSGPHLRHFWTHYSFIFLVVCILIWNYFMFSLLSLFIICFHWLEYKLHESQILSEFTVCSLLNFQG